jgi:hypothetical protein
VDEKVLAVFEVEEEDEFRVGCGGEGVAFGFEEFARDFVVVDFACGAKRSKGRRKEADRKRKRTKEGWKSGEMIRRVGEKGRRRRPG